jgi:hypothetical protein
MSIPPVLARYVDIRFGTTSCSSSSRFGTSSSAKAVTVTATVTVTTYPLTSLSGGVLCITEKLAADVRVES